VFEGALFYASLVIHEAGGLVRLTHAAVTLSADPIIHRL